jgi:VIT1/CCC1 family predicted Fe2+/Mn2+ transporter
MEWKAYSRRSGIAERLIRSIYHSFLHESERLIERRIARLERRFFSKMYSAMVVSSGAVLLVISAIFFFIEFLALTNTISFLIVGIALLFTGIMINLAGGR